MSPTGCTEGNDSPTPSRLPIEPVLDRLAIEVRAERRRTADRHARTLPVKLSFPLVACTLPSFVLLAIVPAVMGALSTLRGTLP
jgi:tight adherence protein C